MLTDALRSFKSKLHSELNSSDGRAKIQDSDFIVGLLQALARAKGNFSLAELRRATCLFLGLTIGQSAFNERLGTASLVKSLQLALGVLITSALRKTIHEDTVDLLNKLGVAEVIGIDASMVTLWDGLCGHFKGTFMEASIKLHLAINLISGAVKWFDISPGATHDSKCFPDLSSGSLYIFDLGYWSSKLLQQISSDGSFFLSRVKSNAKLTVTEVVYGMGQAIIGSNLLDFPIHRRRSTIIEVLATMSINQVDIQFRVLGFWDKKQHAYRWYITNLNSTRHLVYDLYRLRWQIELSFKAMKSTLNFDRMPTLNQNAVVSFTLIALINYVFATIVREEARSLATKEGSAGASSASIQRAAKVFSNGASAILEVVKLGRRQTEAMVRRLKEKILPLLRDVIDPNYNTRKNTLGRLQNA